MSRTALALLLSPLVGVLGCGQLDHAHQCRVLTRLVNGRLDRIDTLSKSGTDRKSLTQVAVEYDALVRDLTAAPISDSKLKPELPELTKVFSRTAGIAHRAARAAQQHDDLVYGEMARELEHLDQHHRVVVRKIDGMCR